MGAWIRITIPALIAAAIEARADVSRGGGVSFPERIGATWIYQYKDLEVQYRLAGREKGCLVLERGKYLEWGRARELLQVDRRGVTCVERQYSDNRVEFSPPWPYLRHGRGADWTEQTTAVFERSFAKSVYKLECRQTLETIQVPAGRFRCVRFNASFVSDDDRGKYENDYWFAPDIGIVKFEFTDQRGHVWSYALKRWSRRIAPYTPVSPRTSGNQAYSIHSRSLKGATQSTFHPAPLNTSSISCRPKQSPRGYNGIAWRGGRRTTRPWPICS
jgi:hypothetical protein